MPKIPFWFFLIVAAVYFSAIRVDTMDIDASQYASMSREMLNSDNWLQVYDHGLEYLDKPPFLFWVSAASMKVFGVNNFGYKFPSILFGLWALYATYRLCRRLYSEATARLAALILATCQGMFLMTNDIRCDTILMSWVITAIWMVKEWDETGKRKYLFLGFAAAGFGMMTKGPIAIMVPVFCFATDWLLKRQWQKLFRWEYLVGLLIIAVLLVPVTVGLYQQFDMHPEKTVNGLTGVSGVRFFYWSQSFGRITGESPWKNGADISFLLLNMLWSFLPWIFIFVPALVANIFQLFRQRFKVVPGQEWLSGGGFLLAYLALGSSAYQLPHYIFVAFPLAAIVTASSISGYLESGSNKQLFKVLIPFVYSIIVLVLGLVLYLVTVIFPAGWLAAALWLVGMVVWIFLVIKRTLTGKFVMLTASAMVIANMLLGGFVYYELLQYQAGSQVGRYLKMEHIEKGSCLFFKMRDPMNSLSFYSGSNYEFTDTIAKVSPHGYVVTMDEGITDIKNAGYAYTVVRQDSLFKVSELTPDFLNPKTRGNTVKPYYLLHFVEHH